MTLVALMVAYRLLVNAKSRQLLEVGDEAAILASHSQIGEKILAGGPVQ